MTKSTEQLLKEIEELKAKVLSADHIIALQQRDIEYLSQQVAFLMGIDTRISSVVF